MNYDILIVDDEKSIADILCDIFVDEDFTSVAKYSGNQAINFLKENKVRLILSDIQMSDGSGLDLLNEVKDKKDRPEVFFMTGHSEYSEKFLFENGAIEVFNKPVDIELLIKKVEKILKE